MPRVNVGAGEEAADRAISKLVNELSLNKIDKLKQKGQFRHTFPGRLRFLRQGWIRRQMYRQHTANIMKNFEQIKINREEIRRRLRNQRANTGTGE
jgi:hypothetical protein